MSQEVSPYALVTRTTFFSVERRFATKFADHVEILSGDSTKPIIGDMVDVGDPSERVDPSSYLLSSGQKIEKQ